MVIKNKFCDLVFFNKILFIINKLDSQRKILKINILIIIKYLASINNLKCGLFNCSKIVFKTNYYVTLYTSYYSLVFVKFSL